jgi:hypothetical protein
MSMSVGASTPSSPSASQVHKFTSSQVHKIAAEPDDNVFEPVEYERLVVADCFFWRTAVVDDTNTRVATAVIPYKILNRLV